MSLRLPTVGAALGSDYQQELQDSISALFDSVPLVLTSVAGTNTLTASVTPALPAGGLDAKMAFWIEPAADNTGGVTLNIGSTSDVPVLTADGSALTAGDFAAGTMYLIRYDGTNFRVIGGGSGASAATVFDYQAFTASGTWNKPAGLDPNQLVLVEAWGAGGGADRAGSGVGTGGGGSYNWRWFRASDLPSSVSVTIGAGGAGGFRDGTPAGGDGGDTTFGSLLTAPGGKGANGSTGGLGGRIQGVSDGLTNGADGVFNAPGNNAIFGGASGGANAAAAGTSDYGGDGGANGGAGNPPGGGGSMIVAQDTGGPGARGEVRVTVL
ncbi:hypothetical protein DDZ14_08555 [Maritimibacter sp. 55A14]|uniref:glycine-rich domain-containing protein n=1 Tax=Maritimibacter sp. 55A14 TaxID=2174844 RepID=UPI000D6228B8|nr:hypothetical protein [Maritimibacter sp. 55A14]PWE32787.1 hypothetical protein DDZ14_08555 [Maritimibacter sp. 55A14]